MEPLQVGGAVAIAFAAIRLAEKAITSAFTSIRVRRNGNPSETLSQEVRELKQVNVSLNKISETLVVIKTEGKQTLAKVCDNADKIAWLKQNEEFKIRVSGGSGNVKR